MAYCTEQDIKYLVLSTEQLIALTDDARTGEIDSAMVSACIEQADAMIDQFIGGRYTTPLSPVPARVTGWSAIIAAVFAHRDADLSQALLRRYQSVKSQLEGVRDGLITIPDADASLLSSGGGLPGSTTEGQCHEFTRSEFDSDGVSDGTGSMEGWL